MTIASEPVIIEIAIEEQERSFNQIKELCCRLLPGWNCLTCQDLELTPISGGISNLLVKVSPQSKHGHLSSVAVKVFGNKTELLIDREKELELLMRLNTNGFGAEVLGTFTNGRIENFLQAKTLTPEEMADPFYVPHIARKLQKLHCIPTDGLPTLWDTVSTWWRTASELKFEDENKQAQFERLDFEAMKQEIDETRAVCDLAMSPVVFSHNDLLSGNILIVEKAGCEDKKGPLGGTLEFIDYEYSDTGFRGFDLGNHFNEYAGLDCDYSRYPGPDQQHLFFRHYLAAISEQQLPDIETTLKRLEAEANVFALASHIYWGVWALIQARYSPIDFDFLQFSAGRWKEYHRRKSEFLQQAKDTFGG